MSRPYWETEEYIEAENELDTYDDPVKLVMEYRESEKQKDQQIAELKKQLHSQPKEIVEKIKDLAGDYFYITGENNIALSSDDFTEILEEILKEYGGEE